MTSYNPHDNRFYDGNGNPIPSFDPHANKIIDEQRAGDAGDYAHMSGTQPAHSMIQSRWDEIDHRVDALKDAMDDNVDKLDKMDDYIIHELWAYRDKHNNLADKFKRFEQLNGLLIRCVIICTTVLTILVLVSIGWTLVAYDEQDRLRDEFYGHVNSSTSNVMEVQDDTSAG